VTFLSLFSSSCKYSKSTPFKFIKKINKILKVLVHVANSQNLELRLEKNGLINHFIGIWPSPKARNNCVDKKWRHLIKGHLSHSFCGWGFFVFLFEEKADKYMIFIIGPYFMGTRGMYLNH
jgi:hypothetical protein